MPLKNCPYCQGNGEYTNCFDQTFKCQCVNRKQKYRRQRDNWKRRALEIEKALKDDGAIEGIAMAQSIDASEVELCRCAIYDYRKAILDRVNAIMPKGEQ